MNSTSDICYSCQGTNNLQSTGNSDGFVCATCISDPDNTNAFCVKCLRYEETDDSTLCGRCQFIHDSEDEDDESDSDEEPDEEPDDDDDDQEEEEPETSFAVLNPYTVQQLYQNSEGDEDALVTPGTSVFAVLNPYTVQLIYNTNKN